MGALLERPVPAADGSDEGPPNTLPSLLRTLHVETQSALAQKSILRAWLGDHDPSPPLRMSMRSNGFGLLLREYDAAHPHN